MDSSTGNRKGVYLAGLVLLILGVLLLFSNLNIIDYGIHDIIFSWKVVLIIIGLIIFITSYDTFGLILILIGGAFLLSDYYNFNPWELWPLILIVIGLRILFRGRNYRYKAYKIKDRHGRHWIERHENIINHDLAFTDIKEMYLSNNFQGGKINAVFSGIKIDLSNAKLADGENILDLSIVFSGISLIVPRDWKVILQISQVLGGASDQRKSSTVVEEGKTLIIKGSSVFGGCEIKSY